MATTTTPRITKAQRFEDIKALLNNNPVKYGTTIDDANKALDHELDLLAKKNNSDSKKQTEAQKKNEEYMTMIMDYLHGISSDSEGPTCGELGKAIPALNDFNTSKLSFLTRKLKERGLIVPKTVKGKTRFTLA